MKKLLFTTLFCILASLYSFAQEGMWLLSQLDQLKLNEKGLLIPVDKIYNPDTPCLADAILQLGGGSASFVSSEGLVVTNHHVAYTALQRASSVSSDYLANGFLARERQDEIPAPGYQAKMMTGMKDVTKEIFAAVKGIKDPVERDKKTDEKIAAMTKEVTDKATDTGVDIVSLYEGRQYVMYTYKVFKDIRIVYAPPSSIGNYGGEIDNWMWPRHTGDFSFMRVYVSPDGEGKEFDKTNVPYKPEVWLKPSTGDLDEGDFNFIIGYPGFTTRYRSSNSVEWNLTRNYPFTIKNFKEIIALAEELTKDDHAGELKVASLVKGLANTMKNYEGNVSGMKKTNFLQKKTDFEKEFTQWANSTPGRKEKYADILPQIKAQYNTLLKTNDRDNVVNLLQGLSGTLTGVAGQIYSVAREMDKPEKERDPGISEENLNRYADRLEYTYNDYYEPLDKAMLLRALRFAQNLPAGQRIAGLESIVNNPEKSVEQWVEEAYKTSRLKDLEYVRSILGKQSSEIDKLNDPFIMLNAGIFDVSEEINKISAAFGANVTNLRKQYIEALYEWKGSSMYPDASSTIRFTWGPVKGYKPADAVWYYPFTTLQGMVEKNTGEEPFNAPEELVRLKKMNDSGRWTDPDLNDVPIAFLNQCDITGGNSGSPVMNANGEIIGIAFDGNWEAMTSNWQYDYELQRCIAVDFRYVMYITEKFGKAGFLLEEMGVK